MDLLKQLEGIDIYLLDQIMKGRFGKGQKILDAGCGRGRNMRLLSEMGAEVFGCDQSEEALMEAHLSNGISNKVLRLCPVEKMPYATQAFDGVICSAVLHFAQSESHFLEMVHEMHRVLKQGAVLFIRMTGTFGLSENYKSLGNGRYYLADESERFLLTEDLFHKVVKIGFTLLEPLKSVWVSDLRSMTTLVLEKH